MFLKGVSAMSSPYPIPVSATQVGTYFVGQYYQVLQQEPHLVHQFYSDSSTMVRVDGNIRETAAAMLVLFSSLSSLHCIIFKKNKRIMLSFGNNDPFSYWFLLFIYALTEWYYRLIDSVSFFLFLAIFIWKQIHALVMSLNFTGIEIKTAYSLESWNGGVLVMVSGSVQVKDFNIRRKFMQMFFLAPQEKGYFVLNDIFHYIDEEQIHQHPTVLLAQHNLDLKLNAFVTNPEPVPSYMLGGDIHGREFLAHDDAKENGLVDKYSFLEQQLQQAPASESIVENNSVHESNGLLLHTVNSVQEHVPPTIEEPVGEPQKQTYASILRVAKGQPAPLVVPQVPVNKNTPPVSDLDHDHHHNNSNAIEVSGVDMVDGISPIEYEGELKSVYVRNLPNTVSESEIMEEFKKFGEISPDGVVIRSRKDVGVCYAFVEFEDITSVHHAVKAGIAQVAGQQVYIEERRPNSYIPSRGGSMYFFPFSFHGYPEHEDYESVAIETVDAICFLLLIEVVKIFRTGRGRGRGSYPTDASRGRFGARSYGRGGAYNGNDRDHSRSRGNGYYRPTPRQD
ncbi:nxt3 [Gossypium australe]|uniref:Nxt3 n=1 Tax=Gossypium australe TaxID=47621 RepID=A0A5B6WV90_9ROSI|nr:nxt3 [Gossypium australe]